MIAVLTGDLVNSSKMSENTYKAAIACLKQQLALCESAYQASGEIYRGDGFQVQYPNPLLALKSSLLLKLALYQCEFGKNKPVQCTLSLAFGSSSVITESPNTSYGEVHVLSGRELEKTAKGQLSVHFQQALQHPLAQRDTALLTGFLSHQLNRLTQTQAALLHQAIELDFVSHQEMASLTGTSRQNISNRLANIGADLVKAFLHNIAQKVSAAMETE